MPSCPACGSWVVRQSRRRGLLEWLLSSLTVSPFRCQLCDHRFRALLGRPSVNPTREYDRLLVRYPVSYTSSFPSTAEPALQGTVVNCSIRGCQIKAATTAPTGTCLRLQILATDQDCTIEVERAVVRSVEADRMNVEFLRVAERELDRLRRLIELRLYARPR